MTAKPATRARTKASAALQTIPARGGKAARLGNGRSVEVINTHGYQVVDFWAFNARDIREFMSMEHTRPSIRKLTPVPGDRLLSNRRRPMLRVVEDTTPGVHDTTLAACCPVRYKLLGARGHHDNCQENLFRALKTLRRTPLEVPCPFNLFQNTRYHPRRGLEFKPPASKPGQFISFEAEMDCIVVFSACPMDLVPINAGAPTEAHFRIV